MKIRFLLICIFAVSATLSVAVATAQQFDNQAEPQLVDMLNLERARAGLPSLKTDDRLTQAAREHSVLMAKAKQLSHEFPGEPISASTGTPRTLPTTIPSRRRMRG